MGVICGVFAMSHVLGAPDGVEDRAERVFQGMREIGRQLRACAPDLLVVISSDHLNNFSLSCPMPFAVGTAPRHVPYGDMGLSREPVPGAADFAGAFAAHAAGEGLAVHAREDIRPDHGVMIPLSVVDPRREIPMLPLYVNTVFDPAPTPAQCHALGASLARFIAGRPADERIALLACGGLSHWLGVPQEGQVNEPWDREFMHEWISGNGRRFAGLDNADILAQAGNGGLEVNAWIVAAGAAPGARGEVVFYEAMPEWASGMGGVVLRPEPASV